VAEEIEKAKLELVAEREQLQQVKNEMNATQLSLDAKKKEIIDLMELLLSRREEFEAIMEDMESTLSDWEKDLADLEVQYDEQKFKEDMATATQSTKPIYSGGGVSSNSGMGIAGDHRTDSNGIVWTVPCDYRKVSSPFGMRMHPVHHVLRMHNGVDLDADCLMHSDGTTDSPILATRDGVVTAANWSDDGGWYVIIDHLDGYRSHYLHMCERPFVKIGEAVSAGQVIGCIGTTGTSTGDHLHFGVSLNGSYVNPMQYIG
jgi:murein DD-endopeptidase MepM/ murein hydrolase activator NlpD